MLMMLIFKLLNHVVEKCGEFFGLLTSISTMIAWRSCRIYIYCGLLICSSIVRAEIRKNAFQLQTKQIQQ